VDSIAFESEVAQLQQLQERVPGELLRGPLSPLDPLSPCECELSLTFGTQDHTW
jgi:hypothetical protein